MTLEDHIREQYLGDADWSRLETPIVRLLGDALIDLARAYDALQDEAMRLAAIVHGGVEEDAAV